MLSQNVLFESDSPGDDPYQPPGAGIAQRLAESLSSQGYRPGPIDNWRDCGWSFDVVVHGAALQVALAATAQPRLWLLQAGPADRLGFLARLLGRRAADRSLELFELASAVHRELVESGCRAMRWRIDSYPDDGESSPEPRRRDQNRA